MDQVGTYDISPNLSHKDRVLERLKAAMDYNENEGWVSGLELATEEIGGLNATRRIRELRQEGWDIQQQSEGRSAYYRLRLSVGRKTNACGRCGKDAFRGRRFIDQVKHLEITSCSKCEYWFDSRSGYIRG